MKLLVGQKRTFSVGSENVFASAYGQVLAAAQEGGRLRMWHSSTAEEVALPADLPMVIGIVALSTDGRVAAFVADRELVCARQDGSGWVVAR